MNEPLTARQAPASFLRHSRAGGNLDKVKPKLCRNQSAKLNLIVDWIPAYAGMTG